MLHGVHLIPAQSQTHKHVPKSADVAQIPSSNITNTARTPERERTAPDVYLCIFKVYMILDIHLSTESELVYMKLKKKNYNRLRANNNRIFIH